MSKRRLSKGEKEDLIEKISDILKEEGFVLFAYIFGSFASDSDFKDIDIGIFVSGESRSSLELELDLEGKIEDIIHIPVDVRVMNNAPPYFIYNILKEGVIIVDRDKSIRSDFEGLIYKKYFEFQHLRNEYLREIINATV